MRIKLHVQVGRKRSRTLKVRGPEAVIGRARGNAVRIPSNDVSRQHCRLCVENGEVTIQDLQSLNGTFLNEERVEGVQTVHSGDRIQVGPVSLVVEYEAVSEEIEVQPEDEEFDVELVEDDGLGQLVERISTDDGSRPDFEVVEEEQPKKKAKADKTSSKQETLPPAEKAPPKKAKPVKRDTPPPAPAEEPETEKRQQLFREDDQAWSVPDPGAFRDMLAGLEEGDSASEDER